jgi:hypothetical protein
LAEGKADDAGEPFVEIILVLGFLCLNDLARGITRHELDAAAFGEIAGEFGIPVILKLFDPRATSPDTAIYFMLCPPSTGPRPGTLWECRRIQ